VKSKCNNGNLIGQDNTSSPESLPEWTVPVVACPQLSFGVPKSDAIPYFKLDEVIPNQKGVWVSNSEGKYLLIAQEDESTSAKKQQYQLHKYLCW